MRSHESASRDFRSVLTGSDRESLLTVQEVADLLRVPVSWVYGHTRRRSIERIPGFRVGKYWRFNKDEVLAWIASQRRDFHAA